MQYKKFLWNEAPMICCKPGYDSWWFQVQVLHGIWRYSSRKPLWPSPKALVGAGGETKSTSWKYFVLNGRLGWCIGRTDKDLNTDVCKSRGWVYFLDRCRKEFCTYNAKAVQGAEVGRVEGWPAVDVEGGEVSASSLIAAVVRFIESFEQFQNILKIFTNSHTYFEDFHQFTPVINPNGGSVPPCSCSWPASRVAPGLKFWIQSLHIAFLNCEQKNIKKQHSGLMGLLCCPWTQILSVGLNIYICVIVLQCNL